MCIEIFQVNKGHIIIKFSDFYVHVQSISLLWCKFQTIILKTVEGVCGDTNSTISVMDGYTYEGG